MGWDVKTVRVIAEEVLAISETMFEGVGRAAVRYPHDADRDRRAENVRAVALAFEGLAEALYRRLGDSEKADEIAARED